MFQTFYSLRQNPNETLLSEHEVTLTIEIAEAVRAVGGRALIVGGYPRDLMMHQKLGRYLETKDVDIEVYGLELENLIALIEPLHHVNAVGESFGVLKVANLDVSVPRKDVNKGRGHRGFSVETDPSLTHKEAARRRDFTINTLAFDPLTAELFDEYGGTKDIEHKIIRMVDADTFGDDPLRSLRAMQFAGRFEFSVDPATILAAKAFDLSELSHERIGEEWHKLLLKAEKPSLGLDAGLALGVIEQLHPQLQALIGTPQEPEWHPEGDVWNHTLMAIDVAASIIRRENLGRDESLTVMFGALTHDFGKPYTTALDPDSGRIRSPEHAKAGLDPALEFMKLLQVPLLVRKKVKRIVYDHMFLPQVRSAKDSAIRRLAKRLQPASIQELLWVTEADFLGRTLNNPDLSLLVEFYKRAEDLAVRESSQEPLVLGRDLIKLGMKPGREMGEMLKRLEKAQEDGIFTTYEGGIEYCSKQMKL